MDPKSSSTMDSTTEEPPGSSDRLSAGPSPAASGADRGSVAAAAGVTLSAGGLPPQVRLDSLPPPLTLFTPRPTKSVVRLLRAEQNTRTASAYSSVQHKVFIFLLYAVLRSRRTSVPVFFSDSGSRQGCGSGSRSAWIRIHFPSWIRIQEGNIFK